MPYPGYHEIENEKKRRNRQEVEHGRQSSLKAGFEVWLERHRMDMGLPANIKFELVATNDDARNWQVQVNGVEIGATLYNITGFPSDELYTRLMLIGALK